VDAVSPIGAGDALAAAFLWAMEKKNDYKDALRWGVAAGTASATLPGMKFASLADAKKVYPNVELRRVE
jgi:fructose-1-phosphate kinase PfkB-like protein